MTGSESKSKRKQGAAKQALVGRKRKGAAVKFQNAQVRAALDSQVHSVYAIKAVDDRCIPGPNPVDESMNGLTDVLSSL